MGKLWLGCCDFVSQSSKQGSQQLQTQCNGAKYFLKLHEFELTEKQCQAVDTLVQAKDNTATRNNQGIIVSGYYQLY